MITMCEGKKENISVNMKLLSIPVNNTFYGRIMRNTFVVYEGNGRQVIKMSYEGAFIKKENHLIYFPSIDPDNIQSELIKLDYTEIYIVENYHPVNLSITYTKE